MGKDYSRAISFEELYKGLKKSQRNVMWKDSVAGYSSNGLRNTYYLRREILDGKYRISKYQQFTIHEPKERDILATRIKDRQYQRSVCDNSLYSEITRHFIRDNVACQNGRGVDDALNRMAVHLHSYYRKNNSNDGWVLKCDIRKFFPSTSHRVAVNEVINAVSDKETAAFACEIIESFSFSPISDLLKEKITDKDELENTSYKLSLLRSRVAREMALRGDTERIENICVGRAMKILPDRAFRNIDEKKTFAETVIKGDFLGIGLGSQVSQLVELLILNRMDHFIKEKLHIRYYLRYMDDFILIHKDKGYLRYCLDEIRKFVSAYDLVLNDKTGMHKLKQGVIVLKWRFILTDSGKVVRKMSDASIIRQRTKLRKLKAKLAIGEIGMDDIRANMQSWEANAKRGDTKTVIFHMRKYYYRLFEEEAP